MCLHIKLSEQSCYLYMAAKARPSAKEEVSTLDWSLGYSFSARRAWASLTQWSVLSAHLTSLFMSLAM